ncbi:MerC domain-containing protein [Flammeovirga kamogawensis]|nr:MerC domain-containing protein [Flammeovirga kamogawensis]
MFAFLKRKHLFCTMIKRLQDKVTQYADQIGFTGSLFCLIHCILTSGVIVVSSAMSHVHEAHSHAHQIDFWGILDLSMIAISGIAVWFASRKTHTPSLKFGMWTSYMVYAVTMLIKYVGYEPTWLAVTSYVASLLLIACHLINLRQANHCENKVCTV